MISNHLDRIAKSATYPAPVFLSETARHKNELYIISNHLDRIAKSATYPASSQQLFSHTLDLYVFKTYSREESSCFASTK